MFTRPRWRQLISNSSCTHKSSRFGADCAKRLSDSVHRYAERQTFVQDVPNLELLLKGLF